VTKVAVIAHAGKSFGGGLPELRRELERQGVVEPAWVEVPKSRFAPKQVRRVLAEGAEVLLVWGGDGMVQRCIDASAGSEVPLGEKIKKLTVETGRRRSPSASPLARRLGPAASARLAGDMRMSAATSRAPKRES